MAKLKPGEGNFGDNLEAIGDMFPDGGERAPGFVVFGGYREGEGFIAAQYRIMDFKTGVVIDEFTLSESGRESLARLSLRAAKRIYGAIPYEGRILKIDEKGVIVNLGSFDGLSAGDVLLHMLGHFRRVLDADDRAELADAIARYRAEQVPLVVPLTLFRHHLRRHEVPWLARQVFLDPHPAEMMLRNHV